MTICMPLLLILFTVLGKYTEGHKFCNSYCKTDHINLLWYGNCLSYIIPVCLECVRRVRGRSVLPLSIYLSTNEKLSGSWQFFEAFDVIDCGSGWRKDVVNQCLEFGLAASRYKSTQYWHFSIRVQELCESRGGRPGLSVLTSLMVSVDVKLHWTMLTHWSQLVPNTSTDIRGH